MSADCFNQEDKWYAGFGLYVLSPTSPPCLPFLLLLHLHTHLCPPGSCGLGLECCGQSHLLVVFLTHCNWTFSLL